MGKARSREVLDAEQEMEEVKSWTCQSCTVMVEDGKTYCLHCELYWEDVRNGLFNDYD